jgi:sugar phosphate isomerase/epimerase
MLRRGFERTAPGRRNDMAQSVRTSGHDRGGLAREIFISAVQFDEPLKAGSKAVLDLAPVAAAMGVHGVEYRDVYWRDKSTELPAVKRQLGQLKLKAAYTTMTPLYHPEPGAQQQLLRDIQDARELGAVVLRINLGQQPGTGPADAKTHYAGRMAVERAAALRVPLTLENNAKAPDHLVSDVKQALDTFSCRFVGTNIDFANYVTTDQDPIEAIHRLARWINYAHAKDVRKTAEGWQATYLGNGTLPLKEIIAALDATGKRPPFCFEFPGGSDPEGSIRKSLEFLGKLEG